MHDDPEHLRDFARRYTAAWCSQDPASMAEHHVPDGSLTINGGTPSVGRPAITEAARSHWTLLGTNIGPGGPGKRVRISGLEESTIGDEGLVAASQGHYDRTEYERQLEHGVPDAG